MTYNTGGTIQATDYNTFATLTNSVNEVYADMHSGATTIAAGADYGYGQTALTSVAAGNNVQATEWAALFTAMRNSGTHQGTTVVPPVPASGPVSGGTIAAFTTPSTISSVISTLRTNRLNLAGGQTSTIVGTTFSNPSSWISQLVYTFQVDFGSWNNARYYFNSGGKVSITATYSTPTTPDETAWANLFSTDWPVNLNWQTTTSQAGGSLVANPAGFYLSSPYPGLTTSYQSIYQKYVGGGVGPYYTTNYALIEAKLTNTAGTNGKIDFRITLVDNDTFPVTKPSGKTSFTINRIQSSGVVAYPGSYTYTSGGFVAT